MTYTITRANVLEEAKKSPEADTIMRRLFPEAFEMKPGTVIRYHGIDTVDYMVTDAKRGDGQILMIQLDRNTHKPNGYVAYANNFRGSRIIGSAKRA